LTRKLHLTKKMTDALSKCLVQFVGSLKGSVKVVPTPYNKELYAFMREGSTKVCNVISLENNLLLFTMGCIFDNDNFDNGIENQTFGAGKLMVERYEVEKRHDKDVLKLRHKDDLGNALLKWSAKKGFDQQTTPLVRQVELTKGKSYDEIRDAMMKDMMAAPAALCKMGIGRGVIYDLIKDEWILGFTADMCVFLARRAFLMQNIPRAAAYCLLDWHLFQLEMSKTDDLWAFQIDPPSEGEGPLCHIKYDNNYLQDATSAFSLKTKSMHRKLGVVNAKVASSLMGYEREVLNASDTASINYLVEIGWTQWLANECYGGVHSKVIGDLVLPKDICEGIIISSVDNVRCLLHMVIAECS